MRVQDLLGWLVPIYIIAVSGSALVVNLSSGRFGPVLLSLAGLGFGVILMVGLIRRREEWLRSERGPEEN